MFDRYEIGQKEYVPYTQTINTYEHRAPTDESIRLYDEIKEKCFKAILATHGAHDNTLNFTVSVVREADSLATFMRYYLKLNGREITGKIRLNQLDSPTDMMQRACREVAEDITARLIQQMMKEWKP